MQTQTNPIIGLMLSDPDLRDQVFTFLRTGGYRVVSIDDPHCSMRMLNKFDMLIVSQDVGRIYRQNLMSLKQMDRPIPILVAGNCGNTEALAWGDAGFDDALTLPMGQSVMVLTVDAYLHARA